MRILCTGQGTFTGDDLVVGKYYETVEVDTPTEQQNKAFHALLQEYWISGCHSYNADNFEQFRNFIKRDLGAGFERYKFVVETENGFNWGNTKRIEDIPANAAKDTNGYPLTAGILKSWSKYTKKERKETLDRLIKSMIQSGCASKKFDEILAGMRSDL